MIYIKPLMRAKVHALSALENKPTWKIVDDALEVYFVNLPKADRLALEAVARRFPEQKRQVTASVETGREQRRPLTNAQEEKLTPLLRLKYDNSIADAVAVTSINRCCTFKGNQRIRTVEQPARH